MFFYDKNAALFFESGVVAVVRQIPHSLSAIFERQTRKVRLESKPNVHKRT